MVIFIHTAQTTICIAKHFLFNIHSNTSSLVVHLLNHLVTWTIAFCQVQRRLSIWDWWEELPKHEMSYIGWKTDWKLWRRGRESISMPTQRMTLYTKYYFPQESFQRLFWLLMMDAVQKEMMLIPNKAYVFRCLWVTSKDWMSVASAISVHYETIHIMWGAQRDLVQMSKSSRLLILQPSRNMKSMFACWN